MPHETPPAKVEPLTVHLDGYLLDALNSYRKADFELRTTQHKLGSQARNSLIERSEAEADRLATWLNAEIRKQLGEVADD